MLISKNIIGLEEGVVQIPTSWEIGDRSFTFSYDANYMYKLEYSFGGQAGDGGGNSRQIYPSNELQPAVFTCDIDETEIKITAVEAPRYVEVFKSRTPIYGLTIDSSSIGLTLPTSISNTLAIDSTVGTLEISGNEIACSFKEVDQSIIYEGDFVKFSNTPQEWELTPEWTVSGGSTQLSKQKVLPQSQLEWGLIRNGPYYTTSCKWTVLELLKGQESEGWTFQITDTADGDYWILSASKGDDKDFLLGSTITITDPFFGYKLQYKIKTNQILWSQGEQIENGWTFSTDIANYSFIDGILTVLWTYTSDDGTVNQAIPNIKAYDTWLQLYEDLNNNAQIRVSGNVEELVINNAVNVTGGMTLGGSLTIPSDQSIEIGEVNLNDLEDSSVVEDGYLYSYEGTTFLFNEYLHGKEILLVSNDNTKEYLVLPSNSGGQPIWRQWTSTIDNTVEVTVKKFPIKINSIITS